MPQVSCMDYIFIFAVSVVMQIPFLFRPDKHILWDLYYVVLLASVLIIDLRHRLIPNALLIGFGIAGAVMMVMAAEPNICAFDRLAGGLLGGGILLVLAMLAKGFGGGDVKYVFLLGLLSGVETILLVLVISFLFGFIASVTLVLCRRMRLTDSIAFGPAISLAAYVLLLVQ